MENADKVYVDLQKHLDKQAVGFPATKSGVELRILKHLFNPEQASLALYLNYIPQSALDIFNEVKGTGISFDKVKSLLEEMEINLSENSQNLMLKILEDLITSGKSTIRQVIMTTHSYDYGKKGQVLRWWVSHNGTETAIKPWTNESEAFLMRMRIGRLIGTFSDDEIRDIFLKACSKDEIKEIMLPALTSSLVNWLQRRKKP